MIWQAWLDLVGSIIATGGGVLLAIPTFRDYHTRKVMAGLDVYGKADENGDAPSLPEIARRHSDARARHSLGWDQWMLKIGVVLLTLGLLLSVPAKLEALSPSQPHDKITN